MRAGRVLGVAQDKHAGIHEQTAIAIFGKPREPVDVGDSHACPFSGSIRE